MMAAVARKCLRGSRERDDRGACDGGDKWRGFSHIASPLNRGDGLPVIYVTVIQRLKSAKVSPRSAACDVWLCCDFRGNLRFSNEDG